MGLFHTTSVKLQKHYKSTICKYSIQHIIFPSDESYSRIVYRQLKQNKNEVTQTKLLYDLVYSAWVACFCMALSILQLITVVLIKLILLFKGNMGLEQVNICFWVNYYHFSPSRQMEKRGTRTISGCSVALQPNTERPRWPSLWVRLLWEVLPPTAPPAEILIQPSSFPAVSVESKLRPESKTETSSYSYESQWLRSDSRYISFHRVFLKVKSRNAHMKTHRQQEDTQLWQFPRVSEPDHVIVTRGCHVTPLKQAISLHSLPYDRTTEVKTSLNDMRSESVQEIDHPLKTLPVHSPLDYIQS